ncbi:MAG TPA: glycosyltransferase family 1 protein [Blastocatellia bacterium]|jgi:hypothetical protein|nr:glycosyltransferase family 1 protein [Blastocatellia bacterium]
MTLMLSIVTGLPPRIDGIGDYALSLARRVREDIGIETRFVVGDPAWSGPPRVAGFEVDKLAERSRAGLLRFLREGAKDARAVLLHYGGYGYATRGCPSWLIDGLRQWRGETGDRFLITMFHELYAFGPPWTSAFWLSPLQRNLAARLARLSDQYLTSRHRYAEAVSRWSLGKHNSVRSLPVFSSVGEPDCVRPLIDRSRRLVIFGTPGRRIQVYRRSAEDLDRICRHLGVEEILDIGRPINLDFARTLRTPVVVRGELSGDDVSRSLSDAIAGVLDYPAEILGKSTIFAAYCAHRAVPVIAAYGKASRADGLEPDTHYWLSDVGPEKLSLAAGQAIADNAYNWYQGHNLSTHAKTLAACLAANGHFINGGASDARV